MWILYHLLHVSVLLSVILLDADDLFKSRNYVYLWLAYLVEASKYERTTWKNSVESKVMSQNPTIDYIDAVIYYRVTILKIGWMRLIEQVKCFRDDLWCSLAWISAKKGKMKILSCVGRCTRSPKLISQEYSRSNVFVGTREKHWYFVYARDGRGRHSSLITAIKIQTFTSNMLVR